MFVYVLTAEAKQSHLLRHSSKQLPGQPESIIIFVVIIITVTDSTVIIFFGKKNNLKVEFGELVFCVS